MKHIVYIRCNLNPSEIDSSEVEKQIHYQRSTIQLAGYSSYVKEFIDCEILNSKAKKTNLNLMLNFVESGDVILIDQYSRLGHKNRDLLNIIHLLQSKNVNLISIKENFNLLSSNGQFTCKIIQDMVEYEDIAFKEKKDMIQQGILKAQKKGRYQNKERIFRTEVINQYIDQYLHSNKYQPYKLEHLVKDTGLSKSTASKFIKLRSNELKNSLLKVKTNHVEGDFKDD